MNLLYPQKRYRYLSKAPECDADIVPTAYAVVTKMKLFSKKMYCTLGGAFYFFDDVSPQPPPVQQINDKHPRNVTVLGIIETLVKHSLSFFFIF